MNKIIYDYNFFHKDLPYFYRTLDEKGILREVHKHNYYEYFFIITGTVIHIINGENRKLSAGDLVLIRMDDTHGYYLEPNQSCSMINVSFKTDEFDELMNFYGSSVKDYLLGHVPPQISLSDTQLRSFTSKIEQLNFIDNKEIMTIKNRIILNEIISLFINDIGEESVSDEMKWLINVMKKMNTPQNIEDGLEAMVRLSNFSHGHLCRLMKQYYNTTPIKYISDLRLVYASNLLISTDFEIVDISLMVGYTSLSHFMKNFKLKFNITPAKYRKFYKASAQLE